MEGERRRAGRAGGGEECEKEGVGEGRCGGGEGRTEKKGKSGFAKPSQMT